MTPSPDPDHALLRRFAAGDRGALGELADTHERGLLGLARGLLGGDSDAACDAVQSTWLRVIRYADGFKGNSSVKTWLYRILINECRDMRRPARRGAPRLRLARDGGEVAGAGDGAREWARDVQAALGALPEEKREIVLLCYHAGVTHAVAADILEVPLGTLKSRLHGALKDLRRALGKTDEEVVA